MTASANLHNLRSIISEFRNIALSGKLKESPTLKFIFTQYKKYKVTDQQLCKAQEELRYVSETYLCYLKSIRQYKDLHKQFQGKGERSTEETANLVGFKIPHDHK